MYVSTAISSAPVAFSRRPQTKQSLPVRVWQRVASFVTSIFKFFTSCFTFIFPFKAAKIQPRRHVFSPSVNLPKTPGGPKTPMHLSPIKHTRSGHSSVKRKLNLDIDENGNAFNTTRVFADPLSKEMNEQLLEFSTQQANAVTKAAVTPILEKVQDSSKHLTPKLQYVLDLLIGNDIESAKTQLRTLQDADELTITKAIDTNYAMIVASDSSKKSKEEITSQLRKSMRHYIREYHKTHKKHAAYRIQENDIEAFVAWFFRDTNARSPLLDNFDNKSRDGQKIFKSLPLLGIRFLLEKKIQNTKSIAGQIQKKVEALVAPGTTQNTAQLSLISKRITRNILGIITDALSDRIVNLTTALSFEHAFDTIIKNCVYETVAAQVLANDEVKASKANLDVTNKEIEKLYGKIERVKIEIGAAILTIRGSTAKNKERLEAISLKARKEKELLNIEAQIEMNKELLAEIREHNGEAQYFENNYLDTFAASPVCDPVIKELITRYIMLKKQNIDPSTVIKHTERDIYASLTDRIIPLLFPPQTVMDEKGQTKQMDFLEYVLEEAEIPAELNELKELVFKLGKEFTTPEINNFLERAQQPLIDLVKGTVKIQAEKILREYIASVVEDIMQKIVDPNKLDSTMANTLLPLLDDILMQKFTQLLVYSNAKESSALYYAYLTVAEDQKEIKKNQKNRLVEFISDVLAKGCSSHHSKQYVADNITTLINTEIETTTKLLVKYHQQCGDTHLSKKRIEEYFTLPNTGLETNADFGKLISKLVFDVGQWKGKGLYLDSILEKAVAPELTYATAEVRNSKDFFAHQAVTILKWINAQPNIPATGAATTEIGIDYALNKTASIAHDMIMFRANNITSYSSANWIAGRVTRMYLGDPQPLTELVKKIYKHTFNNEIINLNLVAKASDAFFVALQRRSDIIERDQLTEVV